VIWWLQEPKLETSSSQQLCSLGNLATAGESHSPANEATVAQPDKHDGLTDDVDAGCEKVCFCRFVSHISCDCLCVAMVCVVIVMWMKSCEYFILVGLDLDKAK